MKLTPEALYMELRQLITEMPDLVGSAEMSRETREWLAHAVALAEATGDVNDSVDAIKLKSAIDFMGHGDQLLRVPNAATIAQIMERVLARAELRAPAEVRGAFIMAGDVYNAYVMVRKVLGEAKADVLIVDPYANETLLEFALLAPEKITVRLLTTNQYKGSLKPAAKRWAQQHAQGRPLEIKVSAPNLLHDRLIVVDGTTAWSLGQYFKDLAVRSPTIIVKTTPPDIAMLKIAAYENLWKAATSL